MLREALKHAVESAIAELVAAGKLPEVVREVPVEISDTKSPEHGDYACNLAMVASKRAGMNPRALGELLQQSLSGSALLDAVEIAGPGFLNLRVKAAAIAAYVPQVITAGEAFGQVKNPDPQRINIEFVSVNPNGPITIGSGRGAAFGSALANVMTAAGNTVHREYYINDGVNSEQMRLFAESVRALAIGQDLPEKGYKGEYVKEVANAYELVLRGMIDSLIEHAQSNVDSESSSDGVMRAKVDLLHEVKTSLESQPFDGSNRSITDHPVWLIQKVSEAAMIGQQARALDEFGVVFDTWFSEQSLHDAGIVAERIAELAATGVADEEPYRTKLKLGKGGVIEETIIEPQTDATPEDEDGSPLGEEQVAVANTLWLRSTKFGDDMDRVLRRRDGRLTYIASDVAYHQDKLNRPENATKLITILGPDHHGYIGRLTAVMAALLRGPEDTPEANAQALDEAKEKLEVVIYQLVRFLKEGKPAPMRKRDGNIYELRDLITELGKNLVPDGTPDEQRQTGRDVARFFYLMRSHDTTMDFDIDLATQQSDENPVFYAQYAHARICSVIRKAAESGFSAETTDVAAQLSHPRELTLIKKVLDLPWEVERVAKDYGVHRLTTYAVELARSYHHFYDACRVIQPDEPALTAARLALCEATRTALRSTFALLGVSAPEKLEQKTRS